jgi:transcriptional regulator with XRE-family HTH domain
VGKPQREVEPYRDELREFRKALGGRIRELRKLKGWSQEEFSDHAHIHRTFAGSLERGEKNVSFHGLVLIARCFGMTLSELLAGLESGERAVVPKSRSLDQKRILRDFAGLEEQVQKLKGDLFGGGPGNKVRR